MSTNTPARKRARAKWLSKPENQAKREAYLKQYQKDNKERLNAQRRERYAKDPSKALSYVHKRKALEAGAPGSWTDDEWKACQNVHGNRCLSCGSRGQLSPDHIIPLSLGGTNWIWNIQPLCRSCNCSKGPKVKDYRYGGAGTTDTCTI